MSAPAVPPPSRRPVRARAAAAAIVCVTALGGCGGAGPAPTAAREPAEADEPPTHASFVAAAERVCAGLQAEIEQFRGQARIQAEGALDPQRLGVADDLMRRVATRTRRLQARLRALPRPVGDPGVTRLFARMQRLDIASAEYARVLRRGGDSRGAEAVVARRRAGLAAALRDYGIEGCTARD
ncbi:hypothetical protein DSM112329_01866 [Paraconexibacter sp. AEG42_29]|uniref:DUF4142 domain-containing protein n=1 Tax=Paraconexibacter sp. AEG42_29 TaxID=2997339 RepID=A0AAU7ATJ9_9ACTN